MAYEGRLVIKWSKRERDIIYHYPRKADGHYAHHALGEPLKRFLDEMGKRGYSRESLFISIKRAPSKEGE